MCNELAHSGLYLYSGSGFLKERLDSLKKMKKKKNEKNACNAFIRILRKIEGVEYEVADCPDERNRSTLDVDFILALESENWNYPKIAVEHTIVEAHEEQKAYVHQLERIEKKIDQRCQGRLPLG